MLINMKNHGLSTLTEEMQLQCPNIPLDRIIYIIDTITMDVLYTLGSDCAWSKVTEKVRQRSLEWSKEWNQSPVTKK